MYLRFSDIQPSTATNQNADFLVKAIQSDSVVKVVLCASTLASDRHESYNPASDGPETNLPLLAAVAVFNHLPVIGDLFIVFDGLFLIAARQARQSEVDWMLGEAVKSEKVYFSSNRKPFTSKYPAKQAVREILAGEMQKLAVESRPILENLLLNCNWKQALSGLV